MNDEGGTMRTIAFVTQKGGSGKSTIASSLAVAAFEAKEKVCVIGNSFVGAVRRAYADRRLTEGYEFSFFATRKK